MVVKNVITDHQGKVFSGLVSVLICAYNAEKYIEQCLQAVVNQTYSNLEIIIVNDGSTDATQAILAEFATSDSRIKLVQNEQNMGFIASLNRGLSFCSGDFIARTDADDIVVLDWIETILHYMVKDETIMAMGGNLEIFAPDAMNGGELAKWFKHGDIWSAPLNHQDIVNQFFFNNPMHHNCMVIRSDIYRQHQLEFDPNYPYAEDYKFWFEVSKLGKLANVNKTLVKYRVHPKQTSSLHNQKQVQVAKQIRREVFDYYFSDKSNNIDYMGEIEIKHIERVLSSEKEEKMRIRLAYELYLSLTHYNLSAFKVFLFKHRRLFSFRQNKIIFKRFLRPHKYDRNL